MNRYFVIAKLLAHPTIGENITDQDQAVLSYLTKVTVEELEGLNDYRFSLVSWVMGF